MRINIYCLVTFSVYFFVPSSLFAIETDTNYECGKDEVIINPFVYNKPVTAQSDLGICYAHSSVQTYTSLYEEVFSEELELSPLFFAFHIASKGYKSSTTYRYWNKDKNMIEKLRGGLYYESFKKLKKTSSCSKEFVEDFLYRFGKTTSLKEALEKSIKFFDLYRANKKKKSKRFLEKAMRTLDLNYNEAKILNDYLEEHGFTRKKRRFKKSYLRTLYSFFSKRCHRKKRFEENLFRSFKVKSYSVDDYTKNEILRALDANFTSEKKTTVGLSYRVMNLVNNKKGNENHSSLIYGKACKNHKLFYLIRNSWGGPSLKEIQTNPRGKNTGRTKLNQTIGGDFWVTTTQLKKTWTKEYGSIHILKSR